MRLSASLLIIFGLFISSVFAQNLPLQYADYKLEANPKYEKVAHGEDNEVVIKQFQVREFFRKDGSFNESQLVHRRVRAITDKGVEGNNKVYIPLSESVELVAYEARVIKPSGEVINLGKDAIKEAYDEESKHNYKYFAFDGLEKGSDVEFFYRLDRIGGSNYFGVALFLQSYETKYNVTQEIIIPLDLSFKFKSYNGLPEMQLDTTVTDKKKYIVQLDKIPAFKEQKSSFDEPNMMYFVYKLDNSTAISYGIASQNYYAQMYENISKSNLKVVSKLIKEIKPDASSEEAAVRSIENYIKTNYTIIDNPNPQLLDFEFIHENKVMSKKGAMMLFANLFKKQDIEVQFVITSNRTEVPFDPDFESYNFLQETMIYFPALDSYMAPSNAFYRLGYLPAVYTNTHGLFIREEKIGDYTTGIGKVKMIHPPLSQASQSNIYADITFDAEFDEPTYHIKCEVSGYNAVGTQPYFDYIKDKEKQDEVAKSQLQYIDSEAKIENLKYENEGANNFGTKPFIVEGDLVSDKFLETAGEKVLFNLGQVIGPQMELYQEGKQEFPIQQVYCRSYHREINFNIPEGYTVQNLDDIIIVEEFAPGESDKPELVFKSSYTQEGNTVKVVIDEYYDVLDLPKEAFNDYRRVINAAADFNKVVLIMTK